MNTMSDHQTKANVNSKDAVAAAAVWRSPEIIKALTSTVTTCFVLGFAAVACSALSNRLSQPVQWGTREPAELWPSYTVDSQGNRVCTFNCPKK